jgi:hypothetical protein
MWRKGDSVVPDGRVLPVRRERMLTDLTPNTTSQLKGDRMGDVGNPNVQTRAGTRIREKWRKDAEIICSAVRGPGA